MDWFSSLPLDIQRYILRFLTSEQQDIFTKIYQGKTIASHDDISWIERMKTEFGFTYRENYMMLKDYKRRIGNRDFYMLYNRYDKVIEFMNFDLDLPFYRMLLDNLQLLNGNLEIKDVNGRTLLMQAAKTEDIKVVQKLIDSGLDINNTDKTGKTALFYAIHSKKNLEMVKLLLTLGANVSVKDSDGGNVLTYMFTQLNPYSYGLPDTYPEIVKLLVEAGVDVNAVAMVTSAYSGTRPMTALTLLIGNFVHNRHTPTLCDYLLAHGADPNFMVDGKTPIMTMIWYTKSNRTSYSYTIIDSLIKAGADLSMTDKNGHTVLMKAVELYGDRTTKDTLTYLIDAGAPLNAVNNDGDTALMILLQGKKFSGPGILLLIKAGTDVTIKNKKGKDALTLANENKTSEEVKQKLKIVTEKALKKKALEEAARKKAEESEKKKAEEKKVAKNKEIKKKTKKEVLAAFTGEA